jgi:sortase A
VAKKNPRELSDDELRWMLVEKRRAARHDRLERYRRTGRVVVVAPDIENSFDDLRSGTLADDEGSDGNTQSAPRSRRRRFLDYFLLIIEVAAVAGFIFVVFNGLNLIKELNQEVAAALEQPTLTPTPLIVAVVLPSGHIPPNTQGGTRPNDAEIPEHLRPLVQSLTNIPVPTPGPEQAIRIQIPAINVDAPIVQGDSWEQLKKGVGQHIGTTDPGKEGNMVLSAHNDIFGEIFRDLDQLKPGDEIVVFTNQRSYSYAVVDSQVVEPTTVEVMKPTKQPSVTLISCYPYMVDDQRIVVSAKLQSGGG